MESDIRAGGCARAIFAPTRRSARIVDQGLALGLDPMLGSQAGRLRLQGHLNDRHLAVIDYIGRIYGRYELQAGLKRRTQSPAYEASKRQAGSMAQSDEEAARRGARRFPRAAAGHGGFSRRGAGRDRAAVRR